MMFLEELLAERARKIRLHELLLLLVRCALIGCLSLALMRPVISSRASGVRSPNMHTSAVILMDDSYSMNAGRPKTPWVEAREQALKYIDTLCKGDDVTVMFTSSAGKGPGPAALFDLDRIREIVKEASPRYEKSDVARALTAALQQLENQHNPRRELVFFSDMQAAGWSLNDGARWSFLSNTVRSSRLPPNIVLASVAQQRPNNIALIRIVPSRAVVDCYAPVNFNVTVANEGPEAAQDVSVSFAVDGAPKATRNVQMASGGSEVLSFEYKFETPGSHYVTCNVRSARDVLPDDNELNYSVMVVDRLPILLVDGDHREQELASETGFLRMALAPKNDNDVSWRTVIEPTVVDALDLRYTNFSKYRVVILCNVAALPASIVSELERFVVGGGGLMVTLGDRVQADIYNRDLYRQGAGLLPVALRQIDGGSESAPAVPRLVSTGDKGPAPSSGPIAVHLAGIVSNAPALELFRPEKGQDWSRAQIRKYFATAAPNTEDVRVTATFSSGAAALVQKSLGEGKVVLFTSAIDMDWSDLPVHPFYVPLMQNLILDLASAVIPPRNLQVGTVLTHVATGDMARKAHLLMPPKGDAIPLPAHHQGSLSVYSYEKTATPGLYSVGPEGDASQRVYYTVAADRDESSMARLEEADFQKLERDLGAHHAPDWNSLARFIGLDSGGYEISHFLIAAAILFCFLEVYLTRRWS